MRHWRILLISIFIIAILSTSSMAAIRTVTYADSLFTPDGEYVDWNSNHIFPYFDPAMGRLISVYFSATLNATLYGEAENKAASPVQNAWMNVDTNMYVEMLNGQHLPLEVLLRVPKTGTVSVGAFDGTWDFLGPSAFNGTDANDTWDDIFYINPADVNDYVGTTPGDTFNLPAVTSAISQVRGGGSWWSIITTLAWSNATITYTYDDSRCLSGYKLDGCTGLPLSGWKIKVNNSTQEWNTTTDGNGFWRICNLENNETYTVCEVLQPGWAKTSPMGCHTVPLAGINITNINFTNQKMYCISGYKKDNCTGAPLSGWNITLQNATGATSQLTGPDGKYQFCNLKPGDYTITEEARAGYIPFSVVANPVTLNCSNITNQNFTNQKLLCINGTKINNCTKLGLDGWTVIVKNSAGVEVGRNITTGGGYWKVCDLAPDLYYASEILQPGWKNVTSLEIPVRLGCNNATDVNFRNTPLLCISGHKKNTCGQFNLSNWTIVLTNSLGGAMSALTNETGYYQFCGLPPGIYNLSEESKEGWSLVSAPQQVTLNCSNTSGMDFVNSECCGSSLKINKTADFGPSPANPAGVNQAINYTIIVENAGNETLYQVNVTDDKLGLREQIASLLPGEFRIFNARYVVAEIDLCGNITNIAWANATDPCSKAFHVSASWSVPTNYTAAIEIDKRADVSSARIGDVINYTYTVTNTGDVNLSGLKIEDDRLGLIDERV
ncbi:MAG: choice-of-anchor E domain-containing protein [Methanothrix sp.]|nr:choice-of-anchor E domain-containing protein [Methanothrix sp.]